jgi:hypothetical protein
MFQQTLFAPYFFNKATSVVKEQKNNNLITLLISNTISLKKQI